CRVIRACRALGIRAVAVYSEADREAPHVQLADAAFLLGPPPAAQSYLDQDRVLAAAKSLSADAIHPGYGFMSAHATCADRSAAPQRRITRSTRVWGWRCVSGALSGPYPPRRGPGLRRPVGYARAPL